MATPENGPKPENPTDVARETLRQLAMRRIAPTPDNYKKLYNEITNRKEGPTAAMALEDFAHELRSLYPALTGTISSLEEAIRLEKWPQCKKLLGDIVTRIQLRSEEQSQAGEQNDDANLSMLKEMLAKTLEYSVVSNIEHDPLLGENAKKIIDRIGKAKSSKELKNISSDLKKLWMDIELRCSHRTDQLDMLKRLLYLLIENIGELMDDDTWLRGQLDMVKEVISGPAHPQTLIEAEQRIKEIIYKQGLVKHSLKEATDTLKTTMKTFVDRMGEAVAATGDYQEKISTYEERISNTNNVHELRVILDAILDETRSSQSNTRKSYDALVQEREVAEKAEARIRELEDQLEKMSVMVREDPMTQSLNRRGLEDEMVREIERSNRYGTPFCIVIIDVDNFKMLNDTFGHQAGDKALIHLVQVAKDELRTLDQVARVGGEEFMIVLPNTRAEEAVKAAVRLQRALTKKFFLSNNDRILITFSAGIAQHIPDEPQEDFYKRADEAMYEAKRSGKNRVCMAKPPSEQ